MVVRFGEPAVDRRIDQTTGEAESLEHDIIGYVLSADWPSDI